MRYDHLSLLPIQAFNKLGKRMTLEGGGKGGDAPESPDYAALAQAQADAQLALNRQTTQANRVNQYTPLGSQVFKQGGGTPYFDQAGYDAAMAAYNKQVAAANTQPTSTGSFMADALGNAMSRGMGGNSISNPLLKMPTRDQFTNYSGNPDQWSETTTYNPQVQNILNQTLGAKSQNYDQLQQYLKNINDPTKVSAAPVNPGQTAQDAIMARLSPELGLEDQALQTQLYNQGVRPGTAAYDNAYFNFNKSKNDLLSQAALQGINLDTQAHQNSLAEQSLPLNAINSYLGGTSVPQPSFNQPSQQANTTGPDLLGAANASYQNQLGAYNAQQAQGGNFMNGLFGLGASALLGGFGGLGGLGGALGAATGGNVAGGINLAGYAPWG